MGILGTNTPAMKHITQLLVLAHGFQAKRVIPCLGSAKTTLDSLTELQGFSENGGSGSLIYECDLNPLDCSLKIEFDLGDSDDGELFEENQYNILLDQANQELQGLGGGDACGFIFLCDLDPLDCSLKIECDLGNSGDDGLEEKNQLALQQASQLQGGDGKASLVLECDLDPFDCSVKIKVDLGDD